ncbi:MULTISPECIES: hypothetical protein [Xanthomonas]|uniref:Porin n=2 Tax=Xanthomonas TaxID=338 RepID=A0A6N7QIY7_9XANT|nr:MULTISPECIES: hypothetical protein [Xanthomonas]AJC46551.1 hypothetical protein SB85_13095 [Xanthomonas sacchari]KAA8919192.1 hypothetical protein CEK64_13645 [Xanthomonas sontii]KAB7772691.1 hypothetical protein CEK69_06910 [Xanthomonas sp. LMG 12462]MCW0376237.1 hypothetical protein [Xanthomonas sacchari]MCW0380183.1 hypothetical protein [Xanthomonas sacchari]
MKFKVLLLSGALALASAGNVQAQDGPELSFSGFGTLGLVHSTEDRADFTPDLQTTEGAGASQRTSPRPDSRIAGQVNATFTDKFSGVLQVTSEYAERASYAPKVTLAHVKYQFAPDFAVRVGRITAPLYMLSEYQRVGYATPWVRPPYEVYNYLMAMDGVEGVYTRNVGQSVLSVQGFYGRIDSKKAEVHAMRGLSLVLDQGASTYRVAYIKGNADYRTDDLDRLFGLYRRINPALAERLDTVGVAGSFASAGYSYDPGPWFARAEVIRADYSPSLNGKTTSGYVSAGARFGALTPSLTYANVDKKAPVIAPGADPLGLMTRAVALAENGRHSYTASLRWDVYENVAFKFQASHIVNNAGSYGSLGNIQPGFRPGGSYNLLSASFDFVF